LAFVVGVVGSPIHQVILGCGYGDDCLHGVSKGMVRIWVRYGARMKGLTQCRGGFCPRVAPS
jgi:hypothetical protein